MAPARRTSTWVVVLGAAAVLVLGFYIGSAAVSSAGPSQSPDAAAAAPIGRAAATPVARPVRPSVASRSRSSAAATPAPSRSRTRSSGGAAPAGRQSNVGPQRTRQRPAAAPPVLDTSSPSSPPPTSSSSSSSSPSSYGTTSSSASSLWQPNGLYSLKATSIRGKAFDLSALAGNVSVVINVATN